MASTVENSTPAALRTPDPVFKTYEKGSFDDVERGRFSQEPLVPPLIDDEGKDDEDPYLVDFDGPDDQTNPLNWSRSYKWAIVILLSSVNLVASVSSEPDAVLLSYS